MTVGIPGTGVSYQTKLTSKTAARARPPRSTEPVCYNEIPSCESGTELLRRDHSWLKIGAALVGILLFVAWIGHTPPQTDVSMMSPHADIQNSISLPVEVAPAAAASRDRGNAAGTVAVLAPEYIRDSASRRGKVVGLMHQNNRFTEFARSGDWVLIGHENPIGWVAAKRLHHSTDRIMK